MLSIFKKFFGGKISLEKYRVLESAFEKAKKDLSDCEEKIELLEKESLSKSEMLVSEQKKFLELETQKQFVESQLQSAKNDIASKQCKLDFIAEVLQQQPLINQNYENFKKLLNEDFMKYANENDSLAEEAAAVIKLQNVSRQLELMTFDDVLINKTVIAIAGSFSSGKSSFINSFFKTRKQKLPTGMSQTTAISSYVMDGEKSITGYSYRGGKIDISDSLFSMFSYGQIEEFRFNMKLIINQIIFKNDFVKPFCNLCFIDTPGFNPGQQTETDYDTATTSISTANAILWCIDISTGTIRTDEYDILYNIFEKNEDIKIYIILNKADQKSIDDSLLIMDEIESQLNEKGIPFEGITLYTSRHTVIDQPEEYKFFKGMSLLEFLENHDVENSDKEQMLLNTVDEVFDEYIIADKNRIKRYKSQIEVFKVLEDSFYEIIDSKDEEIAYYKSRINTKFFKIKSNDDENADADDISEDIFDNLQNIKNELNNTIKKDKADIKKAEKLCKAMKLSISGIFGHEVYNKTEPKIDVKQEIEKDGEYMFDESRIC